MLTLSIWLTANTTYTVRWWFKGTYVNSSSCVPLSVAMLEGFFSRFWTITPYIKSETINKKAKFWYRFYYHFCKRETDKLRERAVWNLTNYDPGLPTCTEYGCVIMMATYNLFVPIVIPTILLREKWLTLNVLIISTVKNILLYIRLTMKKLIGQEHSINSQ